LFSKPLDEAVKTYEMFVLKVCKEQLMTVNVVMFFPKNSYLKETFNRKLNELLTAGIIQYWVRKFADPRFLAIKVGSDEPKVLTIDKLSGVLKVLLIGLAISLIAFFIELFNAKVKPRLKFIRNLSNLKIC
jgi:hypothetical protein